MESRSFFRGSPDSLTCQGDEERQLGIPVSPMCELGTPRVS